MQVENVLSRLLFKKGFVEECLVVAFRLLGFQKVGIYGGISVIQDLRCRESKGN